jgi:BirA family transcriptional regulator, biotin operon repressor / biotin---[acetyl-CoA-carboxylase] ligase
VPRLALKWPNDLLLDGGKLSGLLLEGHRVGAALAVIVGIGVNVASAPDGTPYRATSLSAVRPDLARETVFAALAERFAARYGAWRAGRGSGAGEAFAAVRRLWLERAAGLGAEVALRLPSGERRGIFEGLDPYGRIRLRTDAGQELIDAGDLYFRNLSPPRAALDERAG